MFNDPSTFARGMFDSAVQDHTRYRVLPVTQEPVSDAPVTNLFNGLGQIENNVATTGEPYPKKDADESLFSTRNLILAGAGVALFWFLRR